MLCGVHAPGVNLEFVAGEVVDVGVVVASSVPLLRPEAAEQQRAHLPNQNNAWMKRAGINCIATV